MGGLVTTSARGTGWLLLLTITVLSLVPPTLRPETGVPHDLEHFAIFAAAGLAFGIGYSRRPLGAAIGLVIFAGVIELAQGAVPGRHARLSDFVVDALAMGVGVVAGSRAAGPILRPGGSRDGAGKG
jgi:VanZ family protein